MIARLFDFLIVTLVLATVFAGVLFFMERIAEAPPLIHRIMEV